MQLYKFLSRLLLLSTLLICACATGGMHQDLTAMAKNERERVQEWSMLEEGHDATILGDLINSSALEELVDEALLANPGLQQTLLTLRIRQTEYQQTSGDKWPEVTAGYGLARDTASGTTYTGSLSVSWEVDLWQKLSDNIQAAAIDVVEQEALYQSARDTLAGEVMKAWLGLTFARKNVLVEQQRLDNLEHVEEIIQDRYSNGLEPLAELDSIRSTKASSKAKLEGYRERFAQRQRVLQILLGRTIGKETDVADDYANVLVPIIALPEQTLQRRPDLKASYLAIEAATLRTKVAYKDLLPSISLQTALEDVATSPGEALLTSPLWSLLGQLTVPLFQGGKLEKATKIAELKTAQKYQAYREVLLNAVKETEDAIGLESSLSKQQGYIETALSMAQSSLQQYQNSYRAGLTDILNLFSAQRQTYDLEIRLNNIIYDRLANRINLGLALGLGAQK